MRDTDLCSWLGKRASASCQSSWAGKLGGDRRTGPKHEERMLSAAWHSA